MALPRTGRLTAGKLAWPDPASLSVAMKKSPVVARWESPLVAG